MIWQVSEAEFVSGYDLHLRSRVDAQSPAEAEEAELMKKQRECEDAMLQWRMPPELENQVSVLVAEYSHLELGDFADLTGGGGFKIGDTARRAISLNQLIILAAHVIRRLESNREKWMVKKYVDGVATDHCVTSAYEVCALPCRGAH